MPCSAVPGFIIIIIIIIIIIRLKIYGLILSLTWPLSSFYMY